VRSQARKASQAARFSALLTQRERKMTEIIELRAGIGPGTFTDKAETLLTRFWSKATWRSREGILRTADWLLRMERKRRSGATDRIEVPARETVGKSAEESGGRRSPMTRRLLHRT